MNYRLGQTLSLVALSVILAFFFWAVATESEDPTQEGTFNPPIPLTIEGRSEDRVSYNLSATRARIELRAPQSVWQNLKIEDIRAYIDLSEVPTGTQKVPIQVDVAKEPVRVLSVSPPEVELMVESRLETEVPVTVKIQGSPTFGYRADEPDIAPQVVRVEGPASFVQRVIAGQVTISIQDQQRDVRDDYTPIPVDADGNQVENVSVTPEVVTVNVPIWQLGYIRDLAVTVALEGQPAPGYRVANLEVTPPIVKVFGRTDVVRNAPGFLQTQPLNLEGITRSLTTTVALQMPEGLSVISPPTPEVTASLNIEAIRSGLTLDVRPEIRGLTEGLTATVGLETIVVILSGPLTVMEQLTLKDVECVLDVTNLAPGSYTITPNVNVLQQITIENIIPEAVPVTIEPFTPTPSPFR